MHTTLFNIHSEIILDYRAKLPESHDIGYTISQSLRHSFSARSSIPSLITRVTQWSTEHKSLALALLITTVALTSLALVKFMTRTSSFASETDSEPLRVEPESISQISSQETEEILDLQRAAEEGDLASLQEFGEMLDPSLWTTLPCTEEGTFLEPSAYSELELTAAQISIVRSAYHAGLTREQIRALSNAEEDIATGLYLLHGGETRGNSALDVAAFRGHLEFVEHSIVQSEEDPSCAVHNEGVTALHYAAMGGHSTVFFYLLQHTGLRLTDLCREGYGALDYAVMNGRQELVEEILQSSAIEVPQEQRNSAILFASSFGQVEIFSILCDVDQLAFELTTAESGNAWINAAAHNRVNILEYLVSLRTNTPSLRQQRLQEALRSAALHGQVESLRYLRSLPELSFDEGSESFHHVLRAVVRGNSEELISAPPHELVRTFDYRYSAENFLLGPSGFSFPYRGRRAGRVRAPNRERNIAALDYLATVGSYDSNLREEPSQKTLLMLAAESGYQDMVRAINSLPGVDLYLQDFLGRSALDYAVDSGSIDTFKELFLLGSFDINARDARDHTILSSAIDQGHYALVQYLLNIPGIDLMALSEGQTHLGRAVRLANELIVDALCESDHVNIEQLDEEGLSARDIATARMLAASDASTRETYANIIEILNFDAASWRFSL